MSTTDWREVAKESGWDVTFDYYDVRVQRMAEEIARLREIEKLHNESVTEFCDKVNAQTAYSEELRQALRAIDNSPNRVCQCWVIASGALTLPRPGEK